MKHGHINIIVGIFLLAGTGLFASDRDPLWEEKKHSQIEYQKDLSELLLTEIPEAKEIVRIQRDLQIVMIKMRSERYYYLLHNHPDRIVTNQGITGWSNFEWTEENDKGLISSNEEYKNLKTTYDGLKGKNQGHPQWTTVREKFPKIRASEAYRKIHEKLLNALNAIEESLKNR